jgi:hypothetical protein
MMPIVLETGGNGRDVYQHVGLHNLKTIVQHADFQPLKQFVLQECGVAVVFFHATKVILF